MSGSLRRAMRTAIDRGLRVITQPATYIQTTRTSGPTPTITTTNYTCRGLVDGEIERYREAGTITEGDAVVIVPAKSLSLTTPEPNDRITIAGRTWTVRDVGSDPFDNGTGGAVWLFGVD